MRRLSTQIFAGQVAILVATALVGFALAYFLFPRIFAVAVDPLTGARLLCELPYTDRCSPLPANIQMPDQSLPASPVQIPPPPSTAPPPAQQANPGSHK